ncbi:MAG: peptide/nickel transport system permease protein [Planctomycetota bacterium]|jgi:peptide/nickel transport system permease protein
MWNYIVRRLLYNIPVYLGIILLLMFLLRYGGTDPAYMFLGKAAEEGDLENIRRQLGLDKPFFVQYISFLGDIITLNFDQESWGRPGRTAGELLSTAYIPTLLITVPGLFITASISICIGLISAFNRGRLADRFLMIAAVVGMSVSFLVYIIIGQYYGAFKLKEVAGREIFAIEGLDFSQPGWWITYCALPVMISVIVAMGYDTRFYRAVMVEESTKDYMVTAKAKGAGRRKIMFVHMLKNAMIPIITRVMTTLPFLIVGSVLLEYYFNIPGMGNRLLSAIADKDFPVIQTFTAIFAVIFILSNILTDVLYAVVDPRVRLK